MQSVKWRGAGAVSKLIVGKERRQDTDSEVVLWGEVVWEEERGSHRKYQYTQKSTTAILHADSAQHGGDKTQRRACVEVCAPEISHMTQGCGSLWQEFEGQGRGTALCLAGLNSRRLLARLTAGRSLLPDEAEDDCCKTLIGQLSRWLMMSEMHVQH